MTGVPLISALLRLILSLSPSSANARIRLRIIPKMAACYARHIQAEERDYAAGEPADTSNHNGCDNSNVLGAEHDLLSIIIAIPWAAMAPTGLAADNRQRDTVNHRDEGVSRRSP